MDWQCKSNVLDNCYTIHFDIISGNSVIQYDDPTKFGVEYYLSESSN